MKLISMKKILAIGCGGAGMFSLVVASQLRKGRFQTIVLSDEPDIYCRCTSPYVLSGEAEMNDAIQPESMVCDYGLTIVHEKAVKIDTDQQTVLTAAGTVYPYDELVIATGASPYKPSVKGLDGKNVHTVRTSEDVVRILKSASGAEKAVVVGAGVIGIEMAGALRQRGMTVELAEYASAISASIAGPEFASKITGHLTENGIKLRFCTLVKEIGDTPEGKKTILLERDGVQETTTADMVIVAAGVVPNLDILAGTGIDSEKRGILVDSRMRTNIKNIYACGDCCLPRSAVTGERMSSAFASVAIQQSKIVGFQLAGFPIKYPGSVGAFAFRTLGKEYAAAGLSEEAARKKFRIVVAGNAKTTDIYNDLKGKQPLEVKLVFAGPFLRLVGYEAWGNGVIASAETASFAIGMRANIFKMLHFNYIAHPSLTPWPFMNPLIMATEDAMNTLMVRIKRFLRIQ